MKKRDSGTKAPAANPAIWPPPETANRITANVVRIIRMQPDCWATRINTVGVYDEARGKHRKSTTQLGTGDIIACLRSRFVMIEVKAGKDTQRPEQQIVEQEVQRARGAYWLIRSTDDFEKLFGEFLEKHPRILR